VSIARTGVVSPLASLEEEWRGLLQDEVTVRLPLVQKALNSPQGIAQEWQQLPVSLVSPLPLLLYQMALGWWPQMTHPPYAKVPRLWDLRIPCEEKVGSRARLPSH